MRIIVVFLSFRATDISSQVIGAFFAIVEIVLVIFSFRLSYEIRVARRRPSEVSITFGTTTNAKTRLTEPRVNETIQEETQLDLSADLRSQVAVEISGQHAEDKFAEISQTTDGEIITTVVEP